MKNSVKRVTIFLGIISLILTAMPIMNAALAKETIKQTAAVFVDYPADRMRDKKSNELLHNKVKKLFPSSKYTLLPFDAVQMEVRNYREELPQTQHNTLTKEQVQELGQKLHCDYVLYLEFESSAPYDKKINLTCNVRYMAVKEGKYIGNTQIIKESISSKNLDKLYASALEKILEELKADKFMP